MKFSKSLLHAMLLHYRIEFYTTYSTTRHWLFDRLSSSSFIDLLSHHQQQQRKKGTSANQESVIELIYIAPNHQHWFVLLEKQNYKRSLYTPII